MKTKARSKRWHLVIEVGEFDKTDHHLIGREFGLWKRGAGFRFGSVNENDPPQSDEVTMNLPQALLWAARLLQRHDAECRIDDTFWRAVEKWAKDQP